MIRARERAAAGAGSVTTVVIGAGHAGLAMSHCLTELDIDHVVLERGEVANAWRHQRWSSLRLLTPNWQCRLPGHRYAGPAPDDFMTMTELIGFIREYARITAAPVQTETEVTSVTQTTGGDGAGYRVLTTRGEWRCRSVVIASGAFNVPVLPALSNVMPKQIHQITPDRYRHPGELPDGGVLVVGASATGVQLADELQRSGRPVTLAVGEHVRMPRNYRGRDVQWWLDRCGLLDERYDAVEDLARSRRVASPQLVGTPQRLTLDLNALTTRGVRLVGRFAAINGSKALFSGSLRNVCTLADLKQTRLLDTFDRWALRAGIDSDLLPPERFAPTQLPNDPTVSLDLASGETRSIVWATGFRPDYSWLHVPVLDRKGRLRHDGGVVDAPGMYAMGLTFMRRRKSSFIHGAEDDARELSAHLRGYLDATSACSFSPLVLS